MYKPVDLSALEITVPGEQVPDAGLQAFVNILRNIELVKRGML